MPTQCENEEETNAGKRKYESVESSQGSHDGNEQSKVAQVTHVESEVQPNWGTSVQEQKVAMQGHTRRMTGEMYGIDVRTMEKGGQKKR